MTYLDDLAVEDLFPALALLFLEVVFTLRVCANLGKSDKNKSRIRPSLFGGQNPVAKLKWQMQGARTEWRGGVRYKKVGRRQADTQRKRYGRAVTLSHLVSAMGEGGTSPGGVRGLSN